MRKPLYLLSIFLAAFLVLLARSTAFGQESGAETSVTQGTQERRQSSERKVRSGGGDVIRGQELRMRVQESMSRAKEAMESMRMRMQSMSNRSQEDVKTKMMNIRATIERNKIQQELNKTMQQDRMRRADEMTKSLMQKMKDQKKR